MAQETTDKVYKSKGRPLDEKEMKEFQKTWTDIEKLSASLKEVKPCKKK